MRSTVRKLPPSDKSQQFKDGVIWAVCVALLDEDDVYLVTEDTGFYDSRKIENGLAHNLKEELEGRPHRLQLLSSMSELLQSIRVPFGIDEAAPVEAFLDSRAESIDAMLSRTGFTLGAPHPVKVEPFATEVSSRLYIEFAVSVACPDASSEGRPNARLDLSGNGLFDTSAREFLKVRTESEGLTYYDAEGEKKTQNCFLVAGTVVIGHRTIERTLKVPLAVDADNEGNS
jgi:hypothetical protein